MTDLRQAEPSSLADVIADYFRCVDRGEEIDAESLVAEHPHLQEELLGLSSRPPPPPDSPAEAAR